MSADPAWTSAADVEAAVLKLWTGGRILAAKIGGDAVFPFRLRVRGPDSAALATRFGEAQAWIRDLEAAAGAGRGFNLAWREINHRQLGRNSIPSEILVPTETDALRLIRKQAEAKRFETIAIATSAAFPDLLPWLARKSLLALDHAADWPRILRVLIWFRNNPRSGLYLRQVDIPQVDTKFIETRRGLLAELLDIVLARSSLQSAAGSPVSFEARFGLRSKPATVRFRLLDGANMLGGLTDISTPAEQFADLDLDPRMVFITENDVNGLAFPQMKGAMVLFGLGYSLDLLAGAAWLKRSRIVYWGDIDTHGFAMLARLRAYFPAAQSLLMDEETLLTHRQLWVREERPFPGELPLLSDAERRLFEDLKRNRFGEEVRLEQERIAYGCVSTALHNLS